MKWTQLSRSARAVMKALYESPSLLIASELATTLSLDARTVMSAIDELSLAGALLCRPRQTGRGAGALEYKLSPKGLDGELRHKEEYQPPVTSNAGFVPELEQEADRMVKHFRVFYCLERTTRKLVKDRLQQEFGPAWWESAVAPDIRNRARQSLQREEDQGVSRRSEEKIDYVTFGDLGQIIDANWRCFSSLIRNRKAFFRVYETLNVLRNPVAHCCPLGEDEAQRLDLAVKDWFRQLGRE